MARMRAISSRGVERLGQVIIGSDFQAKNAVHIFSACGENQHRNRRRGAQPPQNIEPAHAGEHEIEDDQRVLHGESALETARTVVYRFDSESFRAETLCEKPAKLNVIVDDENAFHVVGGFLHCM